MAIGFMCSRRIAKLGALAAVAIVLPMELRAADVAVTALFSGKAVIVVDNGRPRTVSVGETTPDGVKLLSATSGSAVVEYAGKRQTLLLGQGTRIGSSTPASARSDRVTLTVGSGGHFWASGAINGVPVRFLLDTGATAVALSSDSAKRLGLNYTAGTRVPVRTASTSTAGYRITLDTVSVGQITLNGVDALVLEGRYPEEALLGMSFLSRTQMKREGDTLTLVRRF
jgi:aspartyl protease family protein